MFVVICVFFFLFFLVPELLWSGEQTIHPLGGSSESRVDFQADAFIQYRTNTVIIAQMTSYILNQPTGVSFEQLGS